MNDKTELEKFLDSIIENIPDMIFVKDAAELRFVRFNRAGEDLLGFKKEDLMGKNDYDFFPKDQADFFTSRDRAVLDNKKLVDIPEEPIDTKFKGRRYLHTKKIPILDEAGKPLFLLGISEDITDRKKMEEDLRIIEELRAIDRMKSEFITIAGHQLRTPLSGMRWTMNLLLGGELGPLSADQKSFVQKAYETNNRMIGIVNDLLSADHITSNKLKYIFKPSDLGELIDRILPEMQAAAELKGVSIAADTKGLPKISADASKISVVLENLLENAVKYSKKGGVVRIRAAKKDKMLEVSVIDTGIGIPKEEQQRIFERFYRAANAIRVEPNGSGLGLYIVKSIVEKHGGKIGFDSKEDAGSAFWFTLPVVE